MLDKAAKEFKYDCKIRHLSPKTIDNYGKQLRYLQRFLEKEFSISSIEDVKPSHIKRFLAMMDDAGRKPQYINDLLKVYKTFFNYLESEGHIESSPAKRIRNMKLPKLKLRTFTEKNIIFKEHVGRCSVKSIIRTAKERRPGVLGYAEAMLIAYNAKNKYRLPIKKLYGSQRDEELDDEETDDDTAAI